MVPEAMDIDTEIDGSQEQKIEPPSAASVANNSSLNPVQPPTSAAAPVAAPASAFAPAVQHYKYKYPQAYPTPSGEDDETWNKLYTAADSRMYNKHGKTAVESKKKRISGETYQLALKMLQERKDKAALVASGSAVPSSQAAKPKTPMPAAKKASSATSIKEPSTSSRDGTPSIDKISTMSISEKIKSEGRVRKASSSAALSDHGTPALSNDSTIMGVPAQPSQPAPSMEKPKKKGIAAPVKKRGSKRKHEDSAGTPSSSRRASLAPTGRTGPSSEDDSNDGGEYCICRGPDDHRMMVNCEGGCNEWYHCSCLNMNEVDAKELLDRYICDNCMTAEKFTTWKRMCRYYCVGIWTDDPNPCRKAARVGDDLPSKYCSVEHKNAFFKYFANDHVRHDDEPSRGGRLNAGEVGWLLSQVMTADELHHLGEKPKLPVKEGGDPNRPAGRDYLTIEEEQEIQKIEDRQAHILVQLQLIKSQEQLRVMVLTRAEVAAKYLELKSVKEICGYDSRFAMNLKEFGKWASTDEGKRALDTKILGPRTAETKDIGEYIPMPGHIAANPELADVLRDICIKKRCTKHAGWSSLHKDRFALEWNLLATEKKMLSKRQEDIISDAETTEAMRPEYADNVTVPLH